MLVKKSILKIIILKINKEKFLDNAPRFDRKKALVICYLKR